MVTGGQLAERGGQRVVDLGRMEPGPVEAVRPGESLGLVDQHPEVDPAMVGVQAAAEVPEQMRRRVGHGSGYEEYQRGGVKCRFVGHRLGIPDPERPRWGGYPECCETGTIKRIGPIGNVVVLHLSLLSLQEIHSLNCDIG